MAKVSLRAQVDIRGINPYVLVEKSLAERLKKDWRRPMPVKLAVRGGSQSWSTNLMPVGDGNFWLYLHGLMRRASGIEVGDEVDLVLEFDRAYRNGPLHPMPEQFRRQLQADPRAEQAWSLLAPSRQKEILRYLASLKSPEARDRNIRRAMEVLTGAKRRFMARNWNESD